jgi:NAD(P)-dependent dehydrogenase (short-subunit alcohol dehydrogenase family)
MEARRLLGKIALISGGASGIGRAAALRFAEHGATVVIADLDAAARTAAADVHPAISAVALDVTDDAQWERVVADVAQRHGRLDILINSAGVALGGDIERTTNEQWRTTMGVNVDGVFFGCRAAIGVMKRHGGSIVNMSSVSGIVGGHNLAAYNASKGAVRLLTKSIALHCARKKYGIRCNSVHPTFVDTPMLRKLTLGRDDAEAQRVRDALVAQVPLGRVAQPEEIADLLVYAASDESRFVTGSELVIDGGLTAM